MSVADRAALEQTAGILATALSHGRRSGARMDSGAARAFQTDLRAVMVPFPVPAGRALRDVTLALALQASPTKEAVASLAVRGRRRRALAHVEGQMAVRWALREWPGLRADLLRAFPFVDPDGELVLDGDGLLALADARPGGEPPLLYGRLPVTHGHAGGPSRRTRVATRWSSRHRARREGALPIPVAGPATEPVLDPGEPGTIEALEGKAGHELGIPYDEWDAWRGRYRRDHVRVLEYDAPPGAGRGGPVLDLPRVHAARTRRAGFEGGDVDVDAVVRWRCDLAVGHVAGDARLFAQLAPDTEPLAWCLLVDASASSSLSGGRVMRAALRHADALAAALSDQRDHVGVLAFRSRARERVEIRTLKHFHAAYRPLSRALRPAGYTRLGGALRHAGRRLAAVPARAHVLVYLGDAVPYDVGYGERYGQLDVAKAVEELTADGVHVHHAALVSPDRDALDAMFGDDRWRAVRGDGDLVDLVCAVRDDLKEEL